MANGTIVSVHLSRDAGQVCASVLVAEGGQTGNVEYTGCVANDATFQAMTAAQKKAALTAAVAAVRNQQMATETPVAGLTGSVVL